MVIAVLLIVLAASVSGFRNFSAYQQFSQSVREVKLVLQESQTAARLSVGGTTHGVYIATSSITQFTGAVYDSTDTSNQVISIPGVTLDPVIGGGDEIVFTELNGLPSVTGSITVTGLVYNASTSITINAAGVVE